MELRWHVSIIFDEKLVELRDKYLNQVLVPQYTSQLNRPVAFSSNEACGITEITMFINHSPCGDGAGNKTYSNFYESVPWGPHADDLFLENFNKSKLENANELITVINHSHHWKCARKLLQCILPLLDRNITVSIRSMYHTERLKNRDHKTEIMCNRQGQISSIKQDQLRKFVAACSLIGKPVTRLICIVRSGEKTTFF